MEERIDPNTAARRTRVLAILCMSLFIVGIDVTIVNVALPAIQHTFHASISGLQWIVDAYTLVLASLLLFSGSMADRFGRRRTFQLGLVLFTAGSLLCSLAPSLAWLIVFRMIQAVGGSMLNPVAMSIIVNTFIEPQARARAIGIWGGVVGLSLAFGPVLGGVLVSAVGWRSIFWINIPVGLVAIILTQRYISESRAVVARRPDPGAQFLIVVLLASLSYATIEGPGHGWRAPLIIGLYVLSLLATIALVGVEAHRRDPLLDPRFFRSAPFSAASLIALSAFSALGAFLFLNTLYLQSVRGFSALHAGLLTLPLAGMIVVFAPISGRLVGSLGPRLPLLIAGPAMAIGAWMLSGLTPDTPMRLLIVAYTLFGIGFGLVNAPITNFAVSGMPRSQAGVASGIASTSRQIGASMGVALAGSIVAAGSKSGFVAASHSAWAFVAGCGISVLVFGLVATSPWAARTAKLNEQLFLQGEG